MIAFWAPPSQMLRDLTPGTHQIFKRAMEPAIVIKDHDRVIDLRGFVLKGSRNLQQERYSGVGILLDHCRNVTLRGGAVEGYRINVLLRGCINCRVENMRADFSHSEPIRTSSGQPIDKFLNLRDVDQWTAYGSGFWLHDCKGCHLVHCTAHHAMNGAVLVTSSDCTVYNCDLSYNSAWGLGLWSSSNNRVIWNRIDFCNRPWSGGWGGDAAGLVLVTNSNKNVIVGNSLTHGGDGFFLTDRVQGGWSETDKKFHFADSCDGNLVWNNDGSWASANAFESTFSKQNSFGRNLANNSAYGFWLGYSSDSVLAYNRIERNDHDGVAIEHGSDNRILSNIFDSDREAAIHLWSTSGDRNLDRPSVDNVVTGNQIQNCGVALDLKGSSRSVTKDNGPDAGPGGNSDPQQSIAEPPEVTAALKLKPQGFKSYRESGGPTGQAWIQAGVYAPVPFVNFGSAYVNSTTYKLWFASKPRELSGPGWLKIEAGSNSRYYTATATLDTSSPGRDQLAPVHFVLDSYTRDALAAPASEPPHEMTLRFRSGAWDCKWFTWKDLQYEDRKGWLYLFNSPPKASQTLPSLNGDYSYKSPIPGVLPPDHFALLATRQFDFTPGIYRFTTLSDDGIRVFVDGREIISRWNHHGATPDTVDVSLAGGSHDLRVEYCQEDGAAVLKVDWTKLRKGPG